MTDKYDCFAHLAQHEAEGRDYRVHVVERPASPVLIVAPHGGSIEIGTSELARAIADREHNLFTFDGLKPAWGANRDLHITSHRFDHPHCLALAARCEVAVGIHGCRGESQIFIGGLDTVLTGLLAHHLAAAGLPAVSEGHRYPGRHPQNICNRTARRQGAQLEFTIDFRGPDACAIIAPAVRAALAEYVAMLEPRLEPAVALPS